MHERGGYWDVSSTSLCSLYQHLEDGEENNSERFNPFVFLLKINEWKAKLDQMLPSPLDSIEAWLQEMERLQAEDLPDLQDPFKAMSVFREIIVIFKVC